MKSLLASTLLLALAAVAVYAQTPQTPMRPGQWDVTVQMQMPGMQMPEMKSMQCITAEQLQKDPTSGLPKGAQNSECKVSDYKVNGGNVSWKMACTGAQPVTGEGELMFANDAYNGTIKMVMAQGSMTMKMSGKRTGDCTK